jgi:hypothetical protein
MNNNLNFFDATPARATVSFSLLYFIVAVLMLFTVTSCNSQKTATAADTTQKSNQQRPARQGQRAGLPSVDEVFKMDANGDGKLAKSEVTSPLAKDFARFDANEDGFITKTEFENAPRPQGRRGGGGSRQ